MELQKGKTYCTAIVLSAGQGKRMGTAVQKQYIELEGKPIVAYTLEVFQRSEVIDEILLVVGKGQEAYCRKEIIEKYHLDKVQKVIEGGAERYHSVYCGLKEVQENGYVFIHDGARPLVTEEILQKSYQAVCEYPACVIGMPVKDTIKIADEAGFSNETPERSKVWQIQTPQVFDVKVIRDAYEALLQSEQTKVTDDAMVVETVLGMKVKLVEGSYENIKITTPEDLEIAEVLLKRRKNETGNA